MNQERIWITGGRGFIGRHLGRRLQGLGHRVAGLGHGQWPEAGTWGFGDWLNGGVEPDGLQTLSRLTGLPDVIFHLAGGSAVGPSILAPAEDFRRTVESTLHLLEWVRMAAPRARVVYASSAAVYGTAHEEPIPEEATTAPASPYGFHKRMGEDLAECYARQFGLRVAVARLFSVYGPELRKQLLWDLCGRLRDGQRPLQVFGTGTERRDWLHVEDAVDLLGLLMVQASPDPLRVNGGSGEGVSIRQVAEWLAACWEPGLPVHFTGEVRAGDPRALVADPLRATELGFRPVRTWQAGIEEYVRWFRSCQGESW